MRCAGILMVATIILVTPTTLRAQVAGSTLLGVAAAEMREITMGWSAKRQILGQAVFNEKNERIGAIDDIIVAPNKAVSYAIIGAGGFLNVGRHGVVIPVNRLKLVDGKIILNGATKEALKQMPPFEYAR